MDLNPDTAEKLKKLTFMIEHNPNCASPFLVRLVSPEQGVLDKEHYRISRDTIGFGQTLEAASVEALRELEKARQKFREKSKIYR